MLKFKPLLFLLGLFISVKAMSLPLQSTLTDYIFSPNTPVILSNLSNQTLSTWCEMHINSKTDNSLLIHQLQGNSEIQGTTLNRGNSMTISIKAFQSLTIVSRKNAQTQFTNPGRDVITAHCSD